MTAEFRHSALQRAIRRRARVLTGTAVALALHSFAAGQVQPGNLDPSFGQGGRVLTDFRAGGREYPRAMAFQPDGKLVVVCESAGQTDGGAVVIARYQPDGTLDATFGGDGSVALSDDYREEDLYVADVAIAPDGKIVVTGTYRFLSGPLEILVARLTPGGALDPTFNGSGLVTLRPSAQDARGRAIAVRPTGHIVVACAPRVFGVSVKPGFLQLRPDGVLDPDFGSAGYTELDLGLQFVWSNTGPVMDLALDSSGRILASFETSSGRFTVARLLAQGDLDPGLAGAGWLEVQVPGGSNSVARAILPTEPAGFVVGGDTYLLTGNFVSYDAAVIRFTDAGAPDPTFGTQGFAAAHVTQDSYDRFFRERTFGLGIGPAGAVTVLGFSSRAWPDSTSGMFAFRFTAQGLPDTTYGAASDGRSFEALPLPHASMGLTAATLDPNGRACFLGEISHPGEFNTGVRTHGDLFVARFTATGGLDPTLAAVGAVETDLIESANDTAVDVVVQPDGKILALGAPTHRGGATGSFTVSRYLASGELDPSFGGDGRVVLPVAGLTHVCGMGLQSDGGIVVAGDAFGSWRVARLLSDGSVDTDFGTDGLAIGASSRTSPGTGASDPPNLRTAGVAIDSQDRILLAGAVMRSSLVSAGNFSPDPAVAAFLPDGTLDPNFGNYLHGFGVTTVNINGFTMSPSDIAVDDQGRIFLVGTYGGSTPYRGYVFRFDAAGEREEMEPVNRPGSGYSDRVELHAVAVGASGDLYVAGYPGVAWLRPTFNGYGYGWSSGNQWTGRPTRDLAVQSDGRIASIVDARFLVERHLPNGTPDPEFGNVEPGFSVADFDIPNAGRQKAKALALQADGRIVVAGHVYAQVDLTLDGTRRDLGLVRLVAGDQEPPVADAGPDQSIHAGDLVSLDGSASYDDTTPGADLAYAWSFAVGGRPPGSVAALQEPDTPTASFVADLPGSYELELVVADEAGNVSPPDGVVVSSLNVAPTADAGLDRLALVGTTVELTGAGTDPDLDPLQFAWSLVSFPGGGGAFTFSGANTPTPTLVPDVAGDYVLELVVSDGFADSAPATVTVVALGGAQYAELRLLNASDLVLAFDTSAFHSAGHRQFFANRIAATQQSLQHGNSSASAGHLTTLLSRTDGWLRGQPDPMGQGQVHAADFVVDLNAQVQLYTELEEARIAVSGQ